MSPITYIFGIAAALGILLVVVEMLRRGRLRERHAIWWIVAGVLALVIGVFPTVLDWAAGLLGITLPTNLVFFVSIAVLFLVCIQNSAELTKLENKTRTLAEEVTLLSLRLDQLEPKPHSGPLAPPAEQRSVI
ncbi:hypothetical protein GCM10007382_14570 [Salinibacterium xinjiangense]|uniref:DUF2304 domain-containing protein n=1 Tax=Salinibacterium xinjiangense TaxID=386302 RepID=A0A2C8Y6S5_9MICO|nr:DUF2304 domain-containing protein [Salinibacterium xinjiangense]GGK95425.1 hypothetical protein GCM10007382_14570 [Salinibacterium xinjiangense]SOE45828.1 hypothetical protein SAMN06296378_0103 [Salinibacterium xinjiangense]